MMIWQRISYVTSGSVAKQDCGDLEAPAFFSFVGCGMIPKEKPTIPGPASSSRKGTNSSRMAGEAQGPRGTLGVVAKAGRWFPLLVSGHSHTLHSHPRLRRSIGSGVCAYAKSLPEGICMPCS